MQFCLLWHDEIGFCNHLIIFISSGFKYLCILTWDVQSCHTSSSLRTLSWQNSREQTSQCILGCPLSSWPGWPITACKSPWRAVFRSVCQARGSHRRCPSSSEHVSASELNFTKGSRVTVRKATDGQLWEVCSS